MVSARQRGHGSTILIRDINAHAWPEIYLSGAGWTVVDIDPKRKVGPRPEPADPEQRRTLGILAEQHSQQPDQGQSHAQHKGSTASLLSRLRMALATPVLLFLLQLYLRKIWSRVAIYVCPTADLPRTSLRAALSCAADAGLLRRYGVTREQFAQSLFPAVPGLEPLTRLHARASLGRSAATEPLPPATWPLTRHDYVALYRAVTRQVRGKQPGWRRVLGWLNPATAWQVR